MWENLPIVSVTEYQQHLNSVLENLKYAVKGEVSGFKIAQGKWVTFDLKDKESKVSCFTTIYKFNNSLEEGSEIVCYGSPHIYVPYGRYSFNVEEIQILGEGALRKAFEATKKKLETEGLFAISHKRKLPKFPTKIGIISSEGAAAYTDILRILNNRWSGLEITLASVLVQGVRSAGQIVKAFDYFNQFLPLDIIILARGGGSLEELQSFNDDRVCRAIYASRIPVICGVGHERDVTLSDLVADIRASTPSNAAEIAVPDKLEFLLDLTQKERSLNNLLKNKIKNDYLKLNNLEWRLKSVVKNRLEKILSLEKTLKNSLALSVFRLDKLKTEFINKIKILNQSWDNLLLNKKNKLAKWEQLLGNLNPNNLLKKGYALIYLNKNKKLIKSIKEVNWGDRLNIKISDGNLSALVEKIK